MNSKNMIHLGKIERQDNTHSGSSIEYIEQIQLKESFHYTEMGQLLQKIKQLGSHQEQRSQLVSFHLLEAQAERSFQPQDAGLLFVLSGKAEYQIGDDEYHKLKKGEFLFFPKGIQVYLEAEVETCTMTFYVTPEITKAFLDQLAKYNGYVLPQQEGATRVCIFQQDWSVSQGKMLTKILSEYVTGAQANDYVIHLTLLELMYHIFPDEHMLSKIAYLLNTPYYPEALQKVERYMLQHYQQPLRSKQLAEVGLVSESHLNRLYKKHFGSSPMERVAAIRMEQAAQFLRDSSLTVTDVAEKVGYQSMSAFVQQFKRKFGVSPKEYQMSKE